MSNLKITNPKTQIICNIQTPKSKAFKIKNILYCLGFLTLDFGIYLKFEICHLVLYLKDSNILPSPGLNLYNSTRPTRVCPAKQAGNYSAGLCGSHSRVSRYNAGERLKKEEP